MRQGKPGFESAVTRIIPKTISCSPERENRWEKCFGGRPINWKEDIYNSEAASGQRLTPWVLSCWRLSDMKVRSSRDLLLLLYQRAGRGHALQRGRFTGRTYLRAVRP